MRSDELSFDEPLIFCQRRAGLVIEFNISSEKIEYNLSESNRNSIHRTLKWTQIPRKDRYEFMRTWIDRRFYFLISMIMAAAGSVILNGRDLSEKVHYLSALFIFASVIGYLAMLAFRSFFVRDFTVIPVGNANLLVARDGSHDKILQAIETHRESALRALAKIDPYQSTRQNLLTFRYLFNEGIITKDKFFDLQSQLLPGTAPIARSPSPDFGQEKVIQQSFFGGNQIFRFKKYFLEVEYNRDLLFRRSRSFDYQFIPSDTKFDRTPISIKTNGVLFFVSLIDFALISYIYIEYMTNLGFPEYGFEGFLYALTWFVPWFVGFYLYLRFAGRRTAVVCSKVGPGIEVVVDDHHDRIVAELAARGVAAYRTNRDLDPLMQPWERQALLQSLVRDKIISEDDFRHGWELSDQYIRDIDPLLDRLPAINAQRPVSTDLLH